VHISVNEHSDLAWEGDAAFTVDIYELHCSSITARDGAPMAVVYWEGFGQR